MADFDGKVPGTIDRGVVGWSGIERRKSGYQVGGTDLYSSPNAIEHASGLIEFAPMIELGSPNPGNYNGGINLGVDFELDFVPRAFSAIFCVNGLTVYYPANTRVDVTGWRYNRPNGGPGKTVSFTVSLDWAAQYARLYSLSYQWSATR